MAKNCTWWGFISARVPRGWPFFFFVGGSSVAKQAGGVCRVLLVRMELQCHLIYLSIYINTNITAYTHQHLYSILVLYTYTYIHTVYVYYTLCAQQWIILYTNTHTYTPVVCTHIYTSYIMYPSQYVHLHTYIIPTSNHITVIMQYTYHTNWCI